MFIKDHDIIDLLLGNSCSFFNLYYILVCPCYSVTEGNSPGMLCRKLRTLLKNFFCCFYFVYKIDGLILRSLSCECHTLMCSFWQRWLVWIELFDIIEL